MVILSQKDPSYSFTTSVVELYLNDCNDLLNEKCKIPIAGMSAIKGKSYNPRDFKVDYDENGKWVPPPKSGLKPDKP